LVTKCRLVARERLIELAGKRWSHRVVTITAGPGFGKSVLVAQATAENALAPRGAELVLACTAADRSPAHFLGRLAELIGPERCGRSPQSVDRLTAELSRRWPMGVCVVLDDVHHVTSTRDGEQMLARLVDGAPEPVRFLLAGRRPVRGISRMRAAGEVVDVQERDLALTATESAELARLHGVDPAALDATGGWPAVAALAASYGIHGATEYVWDTVVDHLDDRERRVVATAAAIGRTDEELLTAALADGHDEPAGVLNRLPLVGRTDEGEFVVHDLWQRLVASVLDDEERTAVVDRTVVMLVERQEYERAFELCATHDRWARAADVLTACCRRGHPDVGGHVLAGWLDALPAARWDEPEGLLLRGLVGRVTDPFGDETARVLQRAAEAYRAAGDVAGEVAAASELGLVLRNQDRCDDFIRLLARASELDAAGHPEVGGMMAFTRALMAEFNGDERQVIVELESAPPGSLGREWRALVAFRIATSYLTLGEERPLLDAAERCVELAGGSTSRHILALARWYTGDPQPALAALDAIVADTSRSRLDAVALGSFATMVLAATGRLTEASERLAATEAAADGPLAVLMRGYLVGIRALVAAAHGDDEEARRVLEDCLAEQPLDGHVGWRMASRWLALAYVLVPSARPAIDASDLGDVHRRRVAVARAIVAAREGTPVHPAFLAELRPGLVATTVPLRWAMELAGRLHEAGVAVGREIAETLFALHGQPAKEALRLVADHPVRPIAAGARKLLAALVLAPRHPVRVDVLGPATLRVDDEVSTDVDWQRERVRALLLFLVVHGPARREQIVDALWPDLDPDAAQRNLRVTLTYLQRVLEPDRRKGEAPFFLRQSGSTLTLAGAPHLAVDLYEFESLVERADDADRRGIPSVALELLEQAVDRWRGGCLGEVAYEEWAQSRVTDVTARFVRAAVRAGELNLATGHTDAARRHARRALAADRWSEPGHRVLIAAAIADGDRGLAVRALDECEKSLAELGVEPGPETLMLRRRLYAREAGQGLARSA
jgi:DNA-binding SARP family transcriptional activator